MVSLVSSNTSGVTGSTSSRTITKPTGTAEFDILFCQFAGPPDSSSGTPNFTAPAGWFYLTSVAGGTGPDLNLQSQIVWCKVATNAEPANYTWSDSVDDMGGYVLGISAWRGADVTAPILALFAEFQGSNGSGGSPAVGPTVTLPVLNMPVTNATALLFGAFVTPSGGSIADPAGSSSVYSVAGGTEGTAASLASKAVTGGATEAYAFVSTPNGPFTQKVGGTGLVVVLREAADVQEVTWVQVDTGGQDLRLDNSICAVSENFYTIANNNTQRRSRTDGSVQVEVSANDVFGFEPDRLDQNLFAIGTDGFSPIRADTATLTEQATGSPYGGGDSPIYETGNMRAGMTGMWSETLVFIVSYVDGLFAHLQSDMSVVQNVPFNSFFSDSEISDHFCQFINLDVDKRGDVWVVGVIFDLNTIRLFHVDSSYTVTTYDLTIDLGSPVLFGSSIVPIVGYDPKNDGLLIGLGASSSSSLLSQSQGGTVVIFWDIGTHATINTFTSTMGELGYITASLISQSTNSPTPFAWICLNTGDNRVDYGFTQKLDVPGMTLQRSFNYPPWGYFIFQSIALDITRTPNRLWGWFTRQSPTFFHWANPIDDFVLAYVDIGDELSTCGEHVESAIRTTQILVEVVVRPHPPQAPIVPPPPLVFIGPILHSVTGAGLPMEVCSGWIGRPAVHSQLTQVQAHYTKDLGPLASQLHVFHTEQIGEAAIKGKPGVIWKDDPWFQVRQTNRYHRACLFCEGETETTGLTWTLREAGIR